MYQQVIIRDNKQKNKPIQKTREPKTTHVQMPWKLAERFPFSPRKNREKKEMVSSALKEAEKDREVAKERLDNLVSSSQKVLYQLSSKFPFDFFPDHISIELAQVNIAKHYFFFTAHLQSIPIKNVADVFLDTSILFASLKIIDASFIENSVQVEYLDKNDACKARSIIQGLVVARKEGIDLSQIPVSELPEKVEKLGTAINVDLLK